MSDDHVIAGAWYPPTTSENIKRPTVPACKSCNNRYSAIERYALIRLAMSVDPTHPAAAGIYEKAKRSIDPKLARVDNDRHHRARQREAFMRDLHSLDAVPNHALPFSVRNFAIGSRLGLRIDARRLNLLIEKWTRGFYFCVHGFPLSASAKITVFHVSDRQALEALEKIWHHARAIDGGLGVQVRCWSAEDSSRREELYAFSIWDQVRMYAGVSEST